MSRKLFNFAKAVAAKPILNSSTILTAKEFAAGPPSIMVRMMSQKPLESIPRNMQEISESDKFTIMVDRSREVSGQQTSHHLFSGGFMSSQGAVQDSNNDESSDDLDTRGYDMAGSANLESVLQVNVPEPYSADNQDGNLKEGLPEGLSETMMERGQRWTMEDRIEISSGFGGASH